MKMHGAVIFQWSEHETCVLLFVLAYCNCIVVLIVWTIGQVLALCAAFLCLSDRLMLLLYTALCVTVPVAYIKL